MQIDAFKAKLSSAAFFTGLALATHKHESFLGEPWGAEGL